MDPEELDLSSFHHQQGYKIDLSKAKRRRVLQTNEQVFAYIEEDEGAGFVEGEDEDISWHTHVPEIDQFAYSIEGIVRQRYIGNDGEEHMTEVEPGDAFYLPPGAHNSVEHGEEPNKWIMTMPKTGMVRLENVLDEGENPYDPQDVTPIALEYDNKRGLEVNVDEEAVTRF
jgi:mannose-6-phosphate isomerase-like protein (cupin superfamily)